MFSKLRRCKKCRAPFIENPITHQVSEEHHCKEKSYFNPFISPFFFDVNKKTEGVEKDEKNY